MARIKRIRNWERVRNAAAKKKTSDGGAEFAGKKTGKDGEQVARYCLTSLVPGERGEKNLLSVSFFFCAVLANYIIAPMSVSRPYILSAATTVSDLNKSKVCENGTFAVRATVIRGVVLL